MGGCHGSLRSRKRHAASSPSARCLQGSGYLGDATLGRGTNTVPTEAVNALTPYAVAGGHNFSSVAGGYSSVIGVLAGAPSASPAPAPAPGAGGSTSGSGAGGDTTSNSTAGVPVGAIVGAAVGAGEAQVNLAWLCCLCCRAAAVCSPALWSCTSSRCSTAPPPLTVREKAPLCRSSVAVALLGLAAVLALYAYRRRQRRQQLPVASADNAGPGSSKGSGTASNGGTSLHHG